MIQITDKANCTGCTACYNICPKSSITMIADNEGFLYPKVNTETCIECGLCEKVCPIINYDATPKNDVVNAYAAHHVDEDVWYKSSSGGAFTAITDYIYEHQGIVYGASYDENFKIVHTKAVTPEEAIKFRGSKYAQSELGRIFKEIKEDLTNNKQVLFSGTPCQVAGLKSFLRKDYENLLTVDLICHCVPSPLVFKDYLEYIENKYNKKIVKINMKDKELGWPVQYQRITFEDGSSIFNTEDAKKWAYLFYSYLVIRPSCHKCRYSNFHRTGDITIGDYWGVEKYHSEFNDKRGASIVLINTDKGRKAFNSIKERLTTVETDVVKALPSSLLYATKPHTMRSSFWSEYNSYSIDQLYQKYLHPSIIQRAIWKILRLIKSH